MKPSHLTILTVSFRAFLCTLVTLSAGYSFGTVNHGFQLPMIRYFQGDTLLSQDLLLEIIPAYTTYFFKVIALLNLNYSSLELLFFTLYILSIYALFHALILAFDLIGKHPEYSLLAALAIAAGFLPVLGLKPWQYQLDHSIPGIAMAAWAIYFFLAKREKSAFVTLGTLFNIHALYAAHLFILFGLYLLYRFPWKKFSFADLRPNLELIGLFSILAFPIILWKTTSMTPDESITADWIQALHDVLWYQVFFSDTPYQLLILFTVFIAALLLSLIIIEKNTQLTPAMDRTRVLIYLSLLFCAIQIIFTDLIPLRIALEGQFWRTTQWTAMFGALIIMLALNRQAEKTDIPYSRWMAWSGAALIIMNSLISLILAGLMLIVGTRSTSKATSTINSRLAFSALSISLIIGTAFSTWYWRIDRDFAATLRYPDGNFSNAMLALAAIAYLYLIHKKHHKIAAITILSAVIIQGFLWGKQYHSTNIPDNSWTQIQEWVRTHTQTNAILITPPDVVGFRIYSNRSIVGERKDGGMSNNNKHFALEWRQRMFDLGYHYECNEATLKNRGYGCWVSYYDDLDTDDFIRLINKYQASYVVTRSYHKLELPLLWGNADYSIYDKNTSADQNQKAKEG